MKRIKVFLGILLVILCLIVSLIFYSNKGYELLEYILLVLENTIKTFIGNSPLKLSEVIDVDYFNDKTANTLLILIYAIVIYIAPVFLAASVISAFTSIKLKIGIFIFNLNINKNNSILIFDYNDMVKSFIENEIKNDKKQKIIVLSNKNINDEIRFKYLKKNVLLMNLDNIDIDYEVRQKKIFKFINKVGKIFLFNEDSLLNYTTIVTIGNYLKENSSFSDKKIYCYAEDYHSKVMISNYLNSLVNDLNDNQIIKDYNVFDISSLRIRNFLDDEENRIVSNFNKNNIHTMIIGFGKLGHAVFDEVLNRSVFNQNGKIRIDILGNDIEVEKNYILNRISESYIKQVNDNHYELSNSGDRCDGNLDIYFYNTSVEDKMFYKTVKDILINSEEGIDNIFLCTKQESTTIRTINTLQEMFTKHEELFKNNVRLNVRIENVNKYSNITKLVKNGFDVKIITTANDVLNINSIENRIKINNAIAYNYIYDLLYSSMNLVINGEDKNIILLEDVKKLKLSLNNPISENSKEHIEAVNKWNKLSFSKRQATFGLVLHDSVKKHLLNEKYNRAEIIEELKNVLNIEFNSKNLLEYLEKLSNTKLFDFIKIEHRRWNYMTAFEGFNYDPNGSKNKHQHRCLLTYDKLVKNAPDTVLYDLIPLIYVACDEG